MHFNGCLDRCDADLVAGWAMFPGDPARKANVDIYSGERFLGCCVADQYRGDLDAAGLAGGWCSFAFAPPADVSPADVTAIRAIVADSGYMFACGLTQPILDVDIDRIYRLADSTGSTPVKRFKTCILHIGCEKTGSTTLQKFLQCNRAQLGHAGYFIPLSLAPSPEYGINHSYLPTLAMDDRNFGDHLRDAAGITDARTLLAYRRDIFARLRDEVEGAPADAETLILSSEQCHSRLSSLRSVQHLKQFLDPFCDTFEVVVYLRPQHEVAMSLYGMFLLSGTCNIEMFPPLVPPQGYDKIVKVPPSYFDYASLLDRWAQVFGECAVRPRLFDTTTLRNGDIVDDFMAAIALTDTGLVRPPAQNTNVSAAAQHFLIGLHARGGGAALSRLQGGALGDLLRVRCPGSGIRPPRRDATAFFAQFDASNEAVRARWFPHRQHLFACDFSAYPEISPPPPPREDRVFKKLLQEALRIEAAAPHSPAKARFSAKMTGGLGGPARSLQSFFSRTAKTYRSF